MPKVDPKKIKSALKVSTRYKWGAGLSIVLCFCLAFFLTMPRSDGVPSHARTLSFNGTDYRLEVVRSASDQEKGLGRRSGLDRGAGMDFAYVREGERCFWMQDMKFAVDIIWIGSSGRVTRIEPKVSPKTYPKTYCAVAEHVVELASGEADRAGLRVGQIIRL